MSVSIFVAAQREMQEADVKNIRLYNNLLEGGHEPPATLIKKIRKSGGDFEDLGYEPIPVKTGMVEISVKGMGEIMMGDGLVINISDLPPDTKAIRIYTD